MPSQTGQSCSAKQDGPDGSYKGDQGTAAVTLRKLDAHTILKTDKCNGKTISISRMNLAQAGKP